MILRENEDLKDQNLKFTFEISKLKKDMSKVCISVVDGATHVDVACCTYLSKRDICVRLVILFVMVWKIYNHSQCIVFYSFYIFILL